MLSNMKENQNQDENPKTDGTQLLWKIFKTVDSIWLRGKEH